MLKFVGKIYKDVEIRLVKVVIFFREPMETKLFKIIWHGS